VYSITGFLYKEKVLASSFVTERGHGAGKNKRRARVRLL